MKRWNYKYLIGLILGILLCGSSVYAVIMYSSDLVLYDYASSNLTSSNVQAAIDELATKRVAVTSCPSGKLCLAEKSTLALGDYVRYIPSSSSYTTDTTYTGYTSTQTINPSELTLWRVISLNQDGTVDIISENISSVSVGFSGQTGYNNFVGYLNVLARQYENSAYTVGSRHFGYDNQTEYITDTTYFVNPAPWTCTTGGTCNPDPDDYEAYGGGDTGYLTDYNLIYNVLGTRVAKKVGATAATAYWMASRRYFYSSATSYRWYGRYVVSSGGCDNISDFYYYSNSGFGDYIYYASLRPIVTLKSTLSYYGVGIRDYPMEIQ